tara:strand:- start:33 stop:629 length:597 start_codon:yes stop_codon:yes gene_type:complete
MDYKLDPKRIINIVLVLLLIIFNIQCGIYSFRGSIPSHIKSVALTPVINESAEFSVTELLSEQLNTFMIRENVLSINSLDLSDSKLDIIIKSIIDEPHTYNIGRDDFIENVEEWKISIIANVIWYDIKNDEILFDKNFSNWGSYSAGVDIGTDGLDNDGDGLVDEDDSDEFGSPRESALNISIRRLTEDIVNEITSTW